MAHTNNIRRRTADILALLMAARYTVAEIAERVDMNYESVRKFIDELRAARVAYICSWRKIPGQRSVPAAIVTLGIGVDAPRPKVLTGSERTRRYVNKRSYTPLHSVPVVTTAPNSVFALANKVHQ